MLAGPFVLLRGITRPVFADTQASHGAIATMLPSIITAMGTSRARGRIHWPLSHRLAPSTPAAPMAIGRMSMAPPIRSPERKYQGQGRRPIIEVQKSQNAP